MNAFKVADRFEVIASIQEGMAQSQRGEGISLEKFGKRMRRKHGLSR